MKVLGFVPLLLVAGCSSFDRDWDSWRPTSAQAVSPLAGRWEGIWHSDASGHEGSLRCLITSQNSAYHARYDATYTWCCLPLGFEYTLPVEAVGDGRTVRLRGGAELGCWIAGGWYEYEGIVEQGEFIASYHSSFDHGIFRMKRLE
ncbi:MAG: hypothetical protein HY293_06940 [Planctomycetes bacterium]|nr:hypothetical protein [Planctomycetota bacterium]